MGLDLAAWAANKTVQFVIGGLALLGVILVPVTIRYAIEVNGFTVFGFGWTGLIQQRDDAFKARDLAKADYGQCKTNRLGLQVALNGQNIAILDQAEQGAMALAESKRAAADADASWRIKEARWRAFAAHTPIGATACARAKDTDDNFLEVIR